MTSWRLDEAMLNEMWHAFYCLSPSEVRRMLSQIDGTTRGIPTNLSIESFQGS